MASENKKIFYNSLILFFRLITTSFIGLFSSRFVLQNLGVSDYGLYSVVGGVVVMMAFINTVMTAATYRFIAFEIGKNNEKNINEIFNISLIIHLLMTLIILILSETFGVYYVKNYLNVDTFKIEDALFVLRFSYVTTIFSVLSVPYQGLITALEKFHIQAGIEILRSLLAFASTFFLFYYLGNKLRMYSVLIALSNIAPLVIYYLYTKKNHFSFTRFVFSFNKEKYKEILSFSGWTSLGAAASVSQSTGMAIVINLFFGTILNASFGVARQLNGLVATFAQNLTQAVIPQITKNYSSGNISRSNALVISMAKYSWFLLAIPALPILLETEYLLEVWLGKGNVPESTVFFTHLFIINVLILSLGNGISSIFQANGNIKHFQILQSLTTFLIVPISYVFFKFGFLQQVLMPIYFTISAINYFASLLVAHYALQFEVKPFLEGSLFRILIITFLLTPLFFLKLLFEPSIIRLFSISILAVIYLLILIYFFGLNSTEKNVFNKEIKNNFYKFKKLINP